MGKLAIEGFNPAVMEPEKTAADTRLALESAANELDIPVLGGDS